MVKSDTQTHGAGLWVSGFDTQSHGAGLCDDTQTHGVTDTQTHSTPYACARV